MTTALFSGTEEADGKKEADAPWEACGKAETTAVEAKEAVMKKTGAEAMKRVEAVIVKEAWKQEKDVTDGLTEATKKEEVATQNAETALTEGTKKEETAI